jgi:hypothetical protein
MTKEKNPPLLLDMIYRASFDKSRGSEWRQLRQRLIAARRACCPTR